ncbi:hypothetical protein LINPERHAP2_LOCUS4850, partial [Linum perenne]
MILTQIGLGLRSEIWIRGTVTCGEGLAPPQRPVNRWGELRGEEEEEGRKEEEEDPIFCSCSPLPIALGSPYFIGRDQTWRASNKTWRASNKNL